MDSGVNANDISLSHDAAGLLREFNAAGVIGAADVHVANTLCRLTGEERPELALLTALVVRAVRHGSVCLDLQTLPSSQPRADAISWDIPKESWPQVSWREEVANSPLTTISPAPLKVDGSRVYLSRYWADETHVLETILQRLTDQSSKAPRHLETHLDGYFSDPAYADQRGAAEVAAKSSFSIITGGPGSGKTTTVARLIGVLLGMNPDLRVGLAAPTGKAAARMVEAIHDATTRFPSDHAQRILAMEATTIHRLLRYSPKWGYRQNKDNPLPFDVVIIDETSMVSLDLMKRLLEAVAVEASLVFVGDANQLASVEVGAVFADLIEGLEHHPAKPVAKLGRSRRFGRGIGDVAAAVNEGDSASALDFLRAGAREAESGDEPSVAPAQREALLGLLMPGVLAMHHAALEGNVERALELLETQQLLCAHRDGPNGAAWWNRAIAQRLGQRMGQRLDEHFPGQPLLVLKNDYTLGRYNGDTGVVVESGGRLVVAFREGEEIRLLLLSQLSDVMPAYAMTVHRSQGSQFGRVYVLLPEGGSRILTRELLYTGITRAQHSVRIIGDDATLTTAITRRVERASGLAERLTIAVR